ncbi:uncharacterized protein LOC141642406 [Silene latifolia]|uniref:uncharacterized protein LOC141642406 n=1 Tax=Silene latifolia TaxID=37657 RepID=UPI003D776839
MTNPEQSLIETPPPQPNYSVVHVEHTGHSITPVVFNGKNYDEWSRSFHLALIAKGKIGYINGTIIKPSPTSDKLESWTSTNALVTMWIFNTIAPGLRQQISLRPEAKHVWLDIKNRFSQSNEARIYQLQAELLACRQGPTESLMDYYGRMTAIWDAIIEHDTFPSCSCNPCACDWMNIINSRREKKRVRDFLMGLDDRFSNSRSQIISINPLPNLDLVYNRLLQDEGVRNFSYPKPETVPDAVAFAARVNHGSHNSGGGGRNFKPESQSSSVLSNPNRPFCIACKRHGHYFKKCYRITGEFPERWGERPRDRIYISPDATDLSNAIFVPDTNGRAHWERVKQKSAGSNPRVHMVAGSSSGNGGGTSQSGPPL